MTLDETLAALLLRTLQITTSDGKTIVGIPRLTWDALHGARTALSSPIPDAFKPDVEYEDQAPADAKEDADADVDADHAAWKT